MPLRKRLPKPALPLLANVVACALLCTPLGIALAGLSGWGHRWVDILAQFTAPALVATVILTLLLALLRLRFAGVFGLAICGLLATAVWPQWFPPRGAPQRGAVTISVYSANIRALNVDIDAIARSIARADADVVILVELGDAPAADLDRVLASYPHRVGAARVDRSSGPARAMIASRYPLREVPEVMNDGLAAVTAVAATPLGEIGLMGVHLTRPWPFQHQWGQISQVMAMTDLRDRLPGPVIVAGDFNSISSARIGRQIQAEAGLAPAPGFPGTWHAALPSPFGITIDQVWRSPDLALLDRRLGDKNGSDHRPVITRFTAAARSTP